MVDISAPLVGLALLLGFKHSYDADHLVAVSNLIVRSPSTLSTARLTTTWAAGHMLTASLITIILFSFKETVLTGLLDNLQLLVVLMLFTIGFFGIFSETRYYHEHIHRHFWGEHSHPHYHTTILAGLRRLFFGGGRKEARVVDDDDSDGDAHKAMLGIGIIHGLASNDELLILITISLGVTSLLGLILGVGIFSIGVVLGMLLYGVGLTYPMLRFGRTRVRRIVNVSVAVISVIYAVLLLLGFEGWNPFAELISST